MTQDDFNAFCRALPGTTHVVQWGGAQVWKVGGKVFVIARFDDEEPRFSFKVSDLAFEILGTQPGLRPAPYLASRGLKWIQHYAMPGLADPDLKDYLRQSHRIVALGLSKKRRAELGLGDLSTAVPDAASPRAKAKRKQPGERRPADQLAPGALRSKPTITR
jgi:predicted DNA-binding protein (MmcQ/YjbR family)